MKKDVIQLFGINGYITEFDAKVTPADLTLQCEDQL